MNANSFFPFQRKKVEEGKEQKTKERDRQCRFQPFQIKEKTDGKKNKGKKEIDSVDSNLFK